MDKIEKRDNKNFELHNYLDVNGSPEEIIDKIIKKIPNLEDIGFAGYLEKKWLKLTLQRLIPDKEGNNQQYVYNKKYEEDIKITCKKVIEKCEKYLNGKIHIFLFPTFDKFAREKMNGISGFCPWKNTIFIFINFTNQWRIYLEESIVHELAHALSPHCKIDASIGSWLVLEGIAENFKEFIIPGRKSPWVMIVPEEKAWKIFEEIKEILNENDFNKYSEVFYGTGKYPLWTGYTLGYYLVKRYIKKHPEIKWDDLLKINPLKIIGENH